MKNILSIDTIISDPNIRRGRPTIAGRRIAVSDVVIQHIIREKPIAYLVEQFALNPAQVHAALSYYYAHQDEIDAEIQTDIEEADKMLEKIGKDGKLHKIE